ncbi:leucyl aminopeptidase family protein [Streptomyces sp. NPDC088116]|uniref:leucyl aminopeptidase family protein n=1 Tax=Streptomyces sp. NPDC088116 TaxID=3365825 RepID=UPI0037FCFDA3
MPTSAFSRRRGFVARPGQVVAEPSPDGHAVLLNVGLGQARSATTATFRRAAAAAVRAAGPARTLRLDLALLDDSAVPAADRARAVAEGAALASYRYDAYRSSRPAGTPTEIIVVTAEHEAVAEALAACEGTCLARDLVNCPGGELTPPEFADRVRRLAEQHGLDCVVHEGSRLDRLGLAGLAAVSRGSRQPARFVEVEYVPPAAPSAASPALTVALVGKGITFDSGGLSLKPSVEMRSMKSDMGGAAAVVGALVALPRLGLPVRVRAFLPLAENMPDGDALRIGDVVRHVDGTTTEIVNTDNEGRVVLADVLAHASRPGPRGADIVVDVATLTSAAAHALGTRTGALFSTDDRLADAVLEGAALAGESLCRLPLLNEERRHLRSAVADRVNCSNRYGDTVQAALFLRDFVAAGTPWAHLDIAAAAFNDDGPYDEVPHGGTGFGVRTLIGALRILSAGGTLAR